MRAAGKPAARLTFAAAFYALAEMGLALMLGRYLGWDRAEAGLFHMLRPWCLLFAALLVVRYDWRWRGAFYAGALLLVALSEGFLLFDLGAPNPMPELGRGLFAGLLLVAVIDAILHICRRFAGRWGLVAGSLGAIALMLAWGLGRYEAFVLDKGEKIAAASRPGLMLMTGLPIIWGEGDSLLGGHPSESYKQLEAEFDIRALDVLDEEVLGRGGLLLLAQPRRLEPGELAALDAWIRGGGRTLILTDPLLLWPSKLPLGDARRAPPVGLLAPLLDHWGLGLREAGRGVETRFIGKRKLVVAAPGRFAAQGKDCRVEEDGLVARCLIGKGVAFLVADADMAHDRLWTAGDIPDAADRNMRVADNPLLIADWLDGFAETSRSRLAGDVMWIDPDADWIRALLWGGLPILLAFAAGATLSLRRRNT